MRLRPRRMASRIEELERFAEERTAALPPERIERLEHAVEMLCDNDDEFDEWRMRFLGAIAELIASVAPPGARTGEPSRPSPSTSATDRGESPE